MATSLDPITETPVGPADSCDLARFFIDAYAHSFHALVTRYAYHACPGYSPGPWSAHALSNGAFYLTPDGLDDVAVVDHAGSYVANVSGQAAGLIVSLRALSELWTISRRQAVRDLWLRVAEFARQLPEFDRIAAAAGL